MPAPTGRYPTLVALSLAFLYGCGAATPVEVHPTNNSEIPVEKLFTHEGCTVYRFKDVGYHYYVRCQSSDSAMTSSPELCGKGCVVDRTIPTVGGAAPAPDPRASHP